MSFLTSVWLPTLGHFPGDSLTHPMLITAFLQFRHEGHRQPRNEVGPLDLNREPSDSNCNALTH